MKAFRRFSDILQSLKTGLFSLRLQAWIRRQRGLARVWRLFPQSTRGRFAAALSSRAARHVQFPRTPAWDQYSALPSDWCRPGVVARKSTPGVNIIGYIRGEFGLGESARLYARALINAGVTVALYDLDLDLPHSWQDRTMDDYIDERLPHRVSIVFVNPDYLHAAFERIGQARMEGHYVIACWFWELEVIPANWLGAIDLVDEIMVASGFLEEAFRRVTEKPVIRVPPPLSEWSDSGLQRSDFGLPADVFVFLCTFDFHSNLARKNPQAVIRAFKSAFPPDRDNVRMLIKSSNGHLYPDGLKDLLAMAAGDMRIMNRDEVISRAHVHALQRCCDAYISLHRAEGFGLGLAECMALGKPVIATGWSGNMEFMSAADACIVDYQLVPVAGRYPESEGARWAEADIASAAAAMRRLADDPQGAAAMGRLGSVRVREHLSVERVARCLAARLEELEFLPH